MTVELFSLALSYTHTQTHQHAHALPFTHFFLSLSVPHINGYAKATMLISRSVLRAILQAIILIVYALQVYLLLLNGEVHVYTRATL